MTTKILSNKHQTKIVLIIIIFLGFLSRMIGFNWDQGQHLHPDERFLTMVLNDIKIPRSFIDYLNPQISTLNPYNQGHSFFVYGSFPVNIVKIVSQLINITTYDHIHFVGRAFTIFLDTGVILLIFLIAQKIFNSQIAILSSFFYSISVLPIQLAHFYTVDPFLNFFIVLTFYLLLLLNNPRHQILKIFFLSLSFSVAVASKITAIYFLPVIFITFIYFFHQNIFKLFYYGLFFIFFTLVCFRLNQPQIFTSNNFLNWNLNPQFVKNIKELQSYSQLDYYPPGIQWLKSVPIIFPLKNIIFWGAGLPLGIIFVVSIIYSIFYIANNSPRRCFFHFLILFWVLYLFIYQGFQSVTTMRYFLFIYPFLCLLSGFFIYQIKIFKHPFIKILLFIILLIYPLSFISIYFNKHSRVAASIWIYKNIPVGSTIATEYWDDALPLSVGNYSYSLYQNQEIAVADPDSTEKMTKINNQLSRSNYIILSSNRFYLPIPQNPDIYPQTTKYYQSLFDGSLGFQKVAEFTSFPCFPPIGKALFCIDDTKAEEAFTVYDHPKVIIFQKKSN